MKKILFFLIIVVVLAGTVSAQNRGGLRNSTESVNIQGTLQLVRGSIAVASGSNLYYVPMLMRFSGFIDGLKEGNQISVEGFEYGNVIHPTKFTVDGKSYDFPVYGRGPANPGFQNDRFGPGWGGNPQGRGWHGHDRRGQGGWGGYNRRHCCF